ncbi:MAG: tRNA (pseudouridine(54)-N(1))-methyltransferase TrmY [Thermoplasmata archaeon]
MRRFFLLTHRVPVHGEFTLNDLAGGGGRLDEIARVVSTAFTLSNDLRRDTDLTIVFPAATAGEARRIRLVGARLRHLNPDERSTAALLKNALVRSIAFPSDFESSPGLIVAAADPVEELRRFLELPGVLWLTEAGEPLRAWKGNPAEFSAVLCDPYDPTEGERAMLVASGASRISVGPRSLRSSQVVDLVHNELDLREAAGSPPA